MRAIVLLISLSFAGCGGNDLPEYEILGGLRVLAITSATPEVQAGSGTVSVVPYVSDVNGAGRALSFDAEACVIPTINYGSDPDCAGNPTRQIITTGGTVTGGLLTATNGYTGAVDSITVNVPTAASLATLDSTLRYNGVPLVITFRVYASGGDSVKSFRRILVTTDAAKTLNTNPTLTDVLSNGSAIGTTLPAGEVALTPSYPTSGAGAPESFTELNTEGAATSLTETFTTTWFISSGKLSSSRTDAANSTRFTPPGSVPALGRVVLVAVLRDGRGGVAVAQRDLQ